MQVGRERLQGPTQGPGAHPALKAPMTRLIGRIPVGQVLPRRPGPQDPQNAVQHVARIAPRAAATIPPDAGPWQQWFEDGPLRVSQVHAVEYDGNRNFVSHPAVRVYEIASSVAIVMPCYRLAVVRPAGCDSRTNPTVFHCVPSRLK